MLNIFNPYWFIIIIIIEHVGGACAYVEVKEQL